MLLLLAALAVIISLSYPRLHCQEPLLVISLSYLSCIAVPLLLASLQVEEFDSEIESLQSNVKRKQKPPPRLAHLEESVTRHKTHIGRLEQIIRLLDNDALHPDELSQVVNEEIAEYIDRNQEDFDAYEVCHTLLYSLLAAHCCWYPWAYMGHSTYVSLAVHNTT